MTSATSEALGGLARNELPPHLDENLLTPRFYTTEFEKAAKTDLEIARKDFEAMFKEMEADYNLKHFDRKASLERLQDLSPEDKSIYESYLVRSVVSEFSGFLLFKEISNRFKKAGRPELGQFFTFLARDEARHAGFLGRALKTEGINVDLPNLPKKRAATFFPLSWVLYSLYLSEKIGYWRYILINRHLNEHPEKVCAPLFDFFEPWCQDENRHGDCINMMMRCWPGMTKGFRGKILSRFFLWTVFLTHTLTVCERGDFYKLLGIDPILFDEEVIIQTNNTSKNAFPWVYNFDDGKFLKLRIEILNAFKTWRKESGLKKPLALAKFVSLILRQFVLPMEKTNAVRYGH
ncbi:MULTISPECIES: magnesium-protoporphyrin IX monomethyl ester (oxidative) cyclase [unclassified Prochlorococcus]|uniref:magnesium-protoporphyrin IX monomethyl ester (oxidative) cyclase n=1 Tax=unclassified Prochlorococcus TaxID=2627481 RepID=UPI00053379DB|nr:MULTISPECIES: magnesium-protoporphyrin IX monomethyl ester (oxidative) cyclase [unclassified Prochlorococcus]KGG15311.1 Mg protoporphyrin IX monomethyl ester oxidative cyclase (aerobic) [Prochlorococcus sp. MIT 0602]KGG17590.1 Mg protoporphyrin IX monomethyl ester oxidative cyclase (aerobic) [Prochlorococcus sp. MIT 0603]